MINISFKPKKRNDGVNVRAPMTKEAVSELLKITPDALETFEKTYEVAALKADSMSNNFFSINAQQMKANMQKDERDIETSTQNVLDRMERRIINELLAETKVYFFDGKEAKEISFPNVSKENRVTAKEIMDLPEKCRPQLTGNLMTIEINEQSSQILLWYYSEYMNNPDPQIRKEAYHHFRQGLDILDLDLLTYEIIGTNPNSIGVWFPALVEAANKQDFFKIPATRIIKVPMPILQLTRLDYPRLSKSTLRIVDGFCFRAFGLDEEKDYFIKTGTYSSKFDFRNTHVYGAKEVRELGEYLLFIHHQACQMASPLNNKQIYGVSTTNEWAVREFIKDKENNPCIYKGMPLHTEYRVFVDFDTNEILGANPYWDPDGMKQRLGHGSDADNPHQIHDYIIYQMHEEILMKRYEQHKNTVCTHLLGMLPDFGMSGQWAIDVMQNGDEFWIIDMSLAVNSALSHCVPQGKLKPIKENWIPQITVKEKSNGKD